MNKKIILTLLGVVIGLVSLVAFVAFIKFIKPIGVVVPNNTEPGSIVKSDYKNISYSIEGKPVTLMNGKSEIEIAPGSASKQVTQYFGNEAVGDLNGDNLPDIAVLLTQNSGGSGTFYYVVVALKTQDGYIGTNAIGLGDRIAPQSTEIKDGVLVVNYAVRKAGEPMSTAPSVVKTMWIKVDSKTNEIIEWVKDFEGEANPSAMKLDMKKWIWISTTSSDKKVTVPKTANKFNLTFATANRFSASTDCNGVGGEYSAEGSSLRFNRMMSTLMFCEGSQEGGYSKSLSEVTKYHFTSKGELILDLSSGGIMVFR